MAETAAQSHTVAPDYPEAAEARTRWIRAHRPPRSSLDPHRPYASCVEPERAASGEIVQVATVFLTNRECPWTCLYCDLWKNTLAHPVPPGAIPVQIGHALRALVPAGDESDRAVEQRQPSAPTHLKLYNAGSFFDPKAIPPDDYRAIARLAASFERVIVESHPALVGARTLRFRDELIAAAAAAGQHRPPALEVAMGLETVHPEVLAKLNKRMTLDAFAAAAEFLARNRLDLRTFILVKPPWLKESDAEHWACRSLDFAFEKGSSVAVLIPVRSGNGALDALEARGEFAPPALRTLERVLDYGLGLRRGRVFADLWDLERFSRCAQCYPARASRLHTQNLTQAPARFVECACESAGGS